MIGFGIGFGRNFGIGIGRHFGIGHSSSFRYRPTFRRESLPKFRLSNAAKWCHFCCQCVSVGFPNQFLIIFKLKFLLSLSKFLWSYYKNSTKIFCNLKCVKLCSKFWSFGFGIGFGIGMVCISVSVSVAISGNRNVGRFRYRQNLDFGRSLLTIHTCSCMSGMSVSEQQHLHGIVFKFSHF